MTTDSETGLRRALATLPPARRVPLETKPNGRARTRASLEQAFLAAFENIGGIDKLTLWADDNPDEFFKLITKLFPNQLSGQLKQESLNITFNIDTSGEVSCQEKVSPNLSHDQNPIDGDQIQSHPNGVTITQQ